MKLLASRTDRENMLFLIGMIVIIIGILALLLAYVLFPIQTADISIGQSIVPEILIWKTAN
jgi:cytoskeletal protein RodZ